MNGTNSRPSCGPVPGKFLGIDGQDPSDSISSRLHVDIFCVLISSFEVYSIDSSKRIGNFPEVLNFNRSFFYSDASC